MVCRGTPNIPPALGGKHKKTPAPISKHKGEAHFAVPPYFVCPLRKQTFAGRKTAQRCNGLARRGLLAFMRSARISRDGFSGILRAFHQPAAL